MGNGIHQRYRAIRQGLAVRTPITVLHIGEHETAVATGVGAEPGKILLLAIGSQKTADEFFRHTPPTLGEIEEAIMQVEDEVTRAREVVADYPNLYTTDDAIREIALIAAGHSGTALHLPVEAVEHVFSLLASHSLGRPASSAGISGSTAFAANLLILREFMQHLKFSSIGMVA